MKKLSLLLVLLVLLGGICALTPPAEALDAFITTYYTDATKTTVVGQRGIDCDGNAVNWGVATPFSRFMRLVCP